MKLRRGFTLIELPVVRKRGFTLIELLVVMFIIGLLAALVIVNVSSSRKTARDAKRMSDLRTIQGALEQYNNKNGGYPVTLSATAIAGWPAYGAKWIIPGSYGGYTGMCSTYNTAGAFTSRGASGWIPNLAPDFLPVLPQDPKTISDYGCYVYRSDGKDYTVIAHTTMETLCLPPGQTVSDPSDSCNSVSIQEMDRPPYGAAPGRSASISVFTNGTISSGYGW